MLRYETLDTEDADLILVAYGSSARIALNAMSKARENGYKVGLVRPQTVWPFPYEVIKDLANQAKAFLTVEMSMGQLIEDVKLAAGETPVYHFGRCGGVIHSPAEVYEKIEEILNGGGAAK
jgi:2-oxoglutarate ferredoxin oxidoreductase subunit alpha